MVGGLQYMRFHPDESVFVDPVICPSETTMRLKRSLLMLYSGMTRSADEILKYVEEDGNCL